MAEDERYAATAEATNKDAVEPEKPNDAEQSRKLNNELTIRMFTLDETMYWGREGTPSVIQCTQVPLTRVRQCFRHGGEHADSFNRLIKTLLDHAVVIGQQPPVPSRDSAQPSRDSAQPSRDSVQPSRDSGEDKSCETQTDLKYDVHMESSPDVSAELVTKNEPVGVAWQNELDGWWMTSSQFEDCGGTSENIDSETSNDPSSNTAFQSGGDEGANGNDASFKSRRNTNRDVLNCEACTMTKNNSEDVGSETTNDVHVASNNCEEAMTAESAVVLPEGATAGNEPGNDVRKVAECNPLVDELRPLVEKLISDRFDEICCSCVDDYSNTEDFDYKRDATLVDVESFELRVEAVHTAYINLTNAAAVFTARATTNSRKENSAAVCRLLSPDDERFIDLTFRECLRHTDLRLFRLLVLIVTMLHVVAAHFNAATRELGKDDDRGSEEEPRDVVEEPMYTSTVEIYLSVPPSVNAPTEVLI